MIRFDWFSGRPLPPDEFRAYPAFVRIIYYPREALGYGKRVRRRHTAVVDHYRVKLVSFYKITCFAEKPPAARCAQIKRFLDRERGVILVDQPPIELRRLYCVPHRANNRGVAASGDVAAKSGAYAVPHFFMYEFKLYERVCSPVLTSIGIIASFR